MSWFLERLLFYYEAGGFVMPPLCLCTVILWYALGYRLSLLGWKTLPQAKTVTDEDVSLEELKLPDWVARVAAEIRVQLDKGSEGLRDRLHASLRGLELEISQYRSLVQSIVMVAPLLGLLGTVVGMIETFDSLGDMSLFSQSGGISGGISQALVSTQMGLAVAIPGLVMGRLLARREKRLLEYSDQLIDSLFVSYAQEEKNASTP